MGPCETRVDALWIGKLAKRALDEQMCGLHVLGVEEDRGSKHTW